MKNKKGFTLVELSIVIALIAIVVAMTVSFMALMSSRTTRAKKRNEVINDLSDTEIAIQTWIRHYDNIDFQFVMSADGKSLEAHGKSESDYKDEVFSLSLAPDMTKISRGGLSDWDVKYIRGLKFEIHAAENASSSSGRYIIKCTVTYEDPTSSAGGTESATLIYTTHANATIVE